LAIYESQLKALLEQDHFGAVVAIHMHSGPCAGFSRPACCFRTLLGRRKIWGWPGGCPENMGKRLPSRHNQPMKPIAEIKAYLRE
jgi:hypothetical protein